MNWNNTAVSKDEYYHLLTMLTIKNDVTTLYNLAPHIRVPYVSFGMLPLISFAAYLSKIIQKTLRCLHTAEPFSLISSAQKTHHLTLYS